MAALGPGMLVLCVDDHTGRYGIPGIRYSNGGLHGLTRGIVYTVRDTFSHSLDGTPCVRLVEITRPIDPDGTEAGFAARRFKPLDSSALDVFRQTTADIPEKVEA